MNDHLMMGIGPEDGSFELVSGLPGKGVPPGAVRCPDRMAASERPEEGASGPGARPAEWPLRRPETPAPARHGRGKSHELAAL